jgi:hypothetical protein
VVLPGRGRADYAGCGEVCKRFAALMPAQQRSFILRALDLPSSEGSLSRAPLGLGPLATLRF